MDHLVLPTGTRPYIKVPYKCTLEYTPGDFIAFPERHGWTREHLLGDDNFGGKDPADIEAFFQTWLYFGMLLEILHIAGVKAEAEDFVCWEDDGAFVSTMALPSLLLRWRKKWDVSSQCKCRFALPGSKDDSQDSTVNQSNCKRKRCWLKLKSMEDIAALQKILGILDQVHSFVARYCGAINKSGTIPAAQYWPVQDAITLSIAVLGFTFSEAVWDTYHLLAPKLDWTVDILLKDRLERANWCPARIASTVAEFSIDGLYYIAADPQMDTEDHSPCTDLRCVSKGVDRTEYRTRHVTDDCQCSHHEPPMDEMLEIIRDGGTPLVSWNPAERDVAGQRLCIRRFSFIPGHIPSIEVGANGQLAIPDIVPSYIAISHVWADGLGNERQNSLPACQLSRIQLLVDEIYSLVPNRPTHIPFWMDTLCVPVRREHNELRKKCIVAMRSIYSRAAVVLVLDAGLQKVRRTAPFSDIIMALHGSGWLRRLWTFQEGFLARQLYYRLQDTFVSIWTVEGQLQKYKKQLRQHGQYAPFLDIAADFPTHYELLKLHANRNRLGLNGLHGALLPLMASLQLRRTTRASDEVLCAATILGIDPTPFLNVAGAEDPDIADLRMEAFMRHLGSFSAGIIFNRLPRLGRDGYRWAPRSLMAGRIVDVAVGKHASTDSDKIGRVCKTGLSVGLAVEYPGLKLDTSVQLDTGRMVVGTQQSRYEVELFLEDRDVSSTWDNKLQYFLVSARMPTDEDEEWSAAILGSRNSRDGLELRHECCARLRLVSPKLKSDIGAEVLGDSTVWLVR
ncbi:hypothetical protein BDW75DRAFT_226176 [Aspergillus navahoensis]